MGKGLFWGLIWGWVVALLGLSAASLYLPMPEVTPMPASVEVPVGSEFNKAKDDTATVLPKDDGAVVDTTAPTPVIAEEPGAEKADDTASVDTDTALVPEVSLDSPGTMLAPSVDTGGPSETQAMVLPKEEGDVPPLLGGQTAEPVATESVAPAASAVRLPQISTAPAAESSPLLNTTPAIPAPSIAIGVPVAPLVSEAQVPALPELDAVVPADPRALVRNAKAFENPDDKPMVSIILITPADQTLAPALLDAFGFPVTFAVDPNDPAAAERAQAYFDAGFEVVFLANGIASGANAQDVEVALEASIAKVPVAVGILDTKSGVLKSSRDIQAQTAEKLARTGHGIITYEGGLNGALREADKLGVKNTAIFRVLDDAGESAFAIKRYLSRAAFRAGQAGDVVVIGRTTGDTLQAVIEWALDGRPDEVILAPISAVLSLPR